MTRRAAQPVSPAMVVGALGVVFGDIGTSPLYAFRTVLGEDHRRDLTTVYGLTSTIIWSMVVVVSVLYVGLLMRTDNEGEGGLLALLGLLRRSTRRTRLLTAASVLGMVGAAMFLGDCVITPAISVLSAAEGLEVADPGLKSLVLPIAVVVLVGVFVLQRRGSGAIGKFYGPVMVIWFVFLAVGGAVSLAQEPSALQALLPTHVVEFFVEDPLAAFLALGSVVLVVTGAEALYADLGHFGRANISRAWLLVVLPALVVAYLGEAAAVVRDPHAASDPFYAVVPGWATIPVLALATLATIIASEAVIAGAFTVIHQAAGLGIFPDLRTRHTSRKQAGQIYIPAVNWSLAVAVLAIVALFRASAKLSSAYGLAVSATIVVTISLYLLLQLLQRGHVSRGRVVTAVLCLLVMLTFLGSTLPKIITGGWVPVGIGLLLFLVMSTWWGGQRRLTEARRSVEASPEEMLDEIAAGQPHRVPGTAIFLTQDVDIAPLALRIVVEAGYSVPERVVLLSWKVEDTPGAPANETAVRVESFDDRLAGVVGLSVTLGYRDRLDVQHVLTEACGQEHPALEDLDPDEAWYFVSDPIPVMHRKGTMALWRQRVFLVIDRLSTDRVSHMRLPRERTIVIGREFAL